MKNGIRFCRPKLSKFPKVGDIVIKLKCGKTGVISEEEYKHVAKFFKMLSFLSDTSNTSGNIKVTNKEYGGEITVSPEEYDKVKDKFDIVEIVGDRSKPNTNGHDYVDLGLPSGTKWATMNVGATSETDYGNYYQYGKGAAQYAATSGDSDYSGTEDPLDSSVDTASQVWGGSWHMPTRAQMQELTANTTYHWVTNYKGSGINGGTFIATNGAVLFIPAAGYWYNGNWIRVGSYGYCWGSSPNGSNNARNLYLLNGIKDVLNGSRKCGYSVRPVLGDSTQKGDVICHNDILNKDVIFSQEDWLRLDDTWTATGFVGINTYSEEDAEDGDFIILSKGQTFIIKSEDYNDVRDGWEYVESFEYDYSKDYLTTEALESGTISFNIWRSMGTDYITSISYSTDNGETWTTTNNTNDKEENLQITVNVSANDKILWKGNAQQTGYLDEKEGEYIGSFFSSTARFNVFGNVMSMLYGDDFIGEETLEYDGQLANLFWDYNEELETKVIDASNLSLVATTLAAWCYAYMFRGCSSLITVPSLPAATMASNCYNNMFSGCTSLTVVPVLSATTLAALCYAYMFYGCTSLTSTPELPITTLTEYCYRYMFGGCTGLTTAPELPATTLASGCYMGMFANTNLINAPELPATTLASECYVSMFNNCVSLTSAPELPATTLADDCYNSMFDDCTSLTTAPELPATTLATNCYYGMFYGCTSLITAPELPATTLTEGCYSDMFYGCTNLTTAPELSATTLAYSCYSNMFQDCTSLITAPELPATTLADYCYQYMFQGCTSLTTAPEELPATTLSSYCYNGMFQGCTSLTTAPVLSATTLVSNCYIDMFRNCTNLNSITCLATNISASNSTYYWVYNVASTGTFTKAASMSNWATGNNGIPANWTVQDAT